MSLDLTVPHYVYCEDRAMDRGADEGYRRLYVQIGRGVRTVAQAITWERSLVTREATGIVIRAEQQIDRDDPDWDDPDWDELWDKMHRIVGYICNNPFWGE